MCSSPLQWQQLSWKGMVLPALMHTPPHTPAPQRGHEYQLKGQLCSMRRSWWIQFMASDSYQDQQESRLGCQHGVGQARACQHTPLHPSAQENTQRDALGAPASPRVPAALLQGMEMRPSFPSLPALSVWAAMPHGSPVGEQPDRRGQEAVGETPERAPLQEGNRGR